MHRRFAPLIAVAALTAAAPVPVLEGVYVAALPVQGEQPALDALYASGINFETFLEEADRQRTDWEDHFADGAPSQEALERARALAAPMRLLVVAEDWCSDSVNTVPYLARLVEQVETLEMRIIDSRVGRGLMDSHRTPDDRAATPTVIVLDAAGNQTGSWVERPATLQEWFLASEATLSGRELGRQKQAWYDEDRGHETVREVLDLIYEGAIQSAAHPGGTGEQQATPVETDTISPEDFLVRVEAGDEMLVLDVRRPDEFAQGHVPRAVNIPYTDLEARLQEVRDAGNVDVIVYCRSGRRARIAEDLLFESGFERLLHLEGDMLGWAEKGLPLESGQPH